MGAGISLYHTTAQIDSCEIRRNRNLIHGGAGGIFFSNCEDIVLSNCEIDSNYSGENGGGISWWGGQTNIINCQITNNGTHIFGGGIYTWGGDFTIADCIFENNHAESGGGIHINRSGESMAQIHHSVFSNNTAFYTGGGIDIGYRDSLAVYNCTFFQNTAERGSGIFIGTRIEFFNNIIRLCL